MQEIEYLIQWSKKLERDMEKFNLKFEYISYTTSNLERTVDFYVNHLGFQKQNIKKSEKFKNKSVILEKDGYKIEILNPDYKIAPLNTGIKMFCFSCENIDEAYEKILQLGYKILFDLNFEETSKFFIYRDPNGVFIKLLAH